MSSEWLNRFGDDLIRHNRREMGASYGLHYLPHHPFRFRIEGGSRLTIVTDFILRFPDGIDVYWPYAERPLLDLKLADALLGEKERYILLRRKGFIPFPPEEGPDADKEIRVFNLKLEDVGVAHPQKPSSQVVCLGKITWDETKRVWEIDGNYGPVSLQIGATHATRELLERAIKGADTLEHTSLELLRKFDAYDATGGELIDLVKLARHALGYLTTNPVSAIDWDGYTSLKEILAFFRPFARIFSQYLNTHQLARYPGTTLRRFEAAQARRSTESWSDEGFLTKVDALRNSKISEQYQAEAINVLDDFLEDVVFSYQLLNEASPANKVKVQRIQPL